MEATQKRAMKIIYPDMRHAEAFGAAVLERLDARTRKTCSVILPTDFLSTSQT